MDIPTVYIETSIISYLISRPSRDLIIAGHQNTTQDWWEYSMINFDCFISDFVTNEISKGDSKAANLRLEAVKNLSILELNDEIINLAETYFYLIKLPEKSRLDLFHLAFAVWYNLDYLVTWNCKHIANAPNIRKINNYNLINNLWVPILCTPEELMEA